MKQHAHLKIMRIRCIGLLLSLQELFELEEFVKLVLQVLMLTDLVLAMMKESL